MEAKLYYIIGNDIDGDITGRKERGRWRTIVIDDIMEGGSHEGTKSDV